EVVGDDGAMGFDIRGGVAEHGIAGDRCCAATAGVVGAVDTVGLVGIDLDILDQAGDIVHDAVASAAVEAGLAVIGAAVDGGMAGACVALQVKARLVIAEYLVVEELDAAIALLDQDAVLV